VKIVHGVDSIKKYKKPVVALGVFDGVHRGHITVLKATVKKARSIRGTSIALTFCPHPQKEESLYSLEHRLKMFKALGIDVAIVINFSESFSRISASDFIKEILIKKIGARFIHIGKNFRFGKGGRGDYRTLKASAERYNFKLKVFKVLKIKNKPVSSTFIRSLIKSGKLLLAERLLTRRVSVLGTVIRGNALGRKIGFSTANINPHHEVIPPRGVYAVKVKLDNKEFNGICNIGTRPTLNRDRRVHIEVHIFNFRGDLYGKYLEIEFIKKIRNELKFPHLASLALAIKKDISAAKMVFSYH